MRGPHPRASTHLGIMEKIKPSDDVDGVLLKCIKMHMDKWCKSNGERPARSKSPVVSH